MKYVYQNKRRIIAIKADIQRQVLAIINVGNKKKNGCNEFDAQKEEIGNKNIGNKIVAMEFNIPKGNSLCNGI